MGIFHTNVPLHVSTSLGWSKHCFKPTATGDPWRAPPHRSWACGSKKRLQLERLIDVIRQSLHGEQIHERWICDNLSFVTSQYIIKYNRMSILLYIICFPHCSRELSPSVVIFWNSHDFDWGEKLENDSSIAYPDTGWPIGIPRMDQTDLCSILPVIAIITSRKGKEGSCFIPNRNRNPSH